MNAKRTLCFVLAATMSILACVKATNTTFSSTTAMLADISWLPMNLSLDNLDELCGECYPMAKGDPEVPDSCSFLFNMTVLNLSDITFTIMLSNNFSGYIAVGFSVDNETTGNNNVHGCANDNGVVKLIDATLNNSTLTEVNSSTGEIQGMVNASQMSCFFTVNDLKLTNFWLKGSYIFFISGNFINGTLGPVTSFSINSSADLFILNTASGDMSDNTNATTSGVYSAAAVTSSITTSTQPNSTKSTQLPSTTTIISANPTKTDSSSSTGNNAFQPTATQGTLEPPVTNSLADPTTAPGTVDSGAYGAAAITPSGTTSTQPSGTTSTQPSSTTSTQSSSTTSTQLASSKTTTSANPNRPGNPSSMGNNALQPNAAKVTVILLGAIMIALFSG